MGLVGVLHDVQTYIEDERLVRSILCVADGSRDDVVPHLSHLLTLA
jgi:hypothetical protein